MRSRNLRRNDSPRPRTARRTLGAGLLVLVFPLALAGGCGRDEPRPPPAAGDPTSAALPGSPATAPVATYRLATTRSADAGDTITIEAIAPCRVALVLEQDGLRQGERSRDLEPGDATRIAWYLLPGDDEAPSPGATGTRRGIVHRVRYAFDDASVRESSLRTESTTPSPWIRIANAVPPMSPQPLLPGARALAALGVVDLSSHAGLELLLEPKPAIRGVPAGTPPASVHLVTLWLRVTPR